MSTQETDESEDGWEELMGKDIIMKVLSTSATDDDAFIRFPIKEQPEIGDAVCLDMDVYYIGKDTDHYEQFVQLWQNIGTGRLTVKPAFTVNRWITTIGDGDLPPAFELAARYLKLHQVAVVKSHSKFAFGHSGRSSSVDDDLSIPPLSTVLIVISNKGVASSTSELFHDPKFRIMRAAHKKKIANDCYAHEWIEDGMGKHRALKLYGSSCEVLTNLLRDLDQNEKDPEIDSVRQEAVQLLVDCFNNISAYHLRDKAYGKAKEAAANALRLHPDNRKALLRAARAAMLDPAGTFEECDIALTVLENIDADDIETKKLRFELQKKIKDYKKREKEMYSRMVKGISKPIGECTTADRSSSIEASFEPTDSTEKDRLNFRSILYSWIIHIGVIGLLWCYFPILREKFTA